MVVLFFYRLLEDSIVHDFAPHNVITPYHCFDKYSSDIDVYQRFSGERVFLSFLKNVFIMNVLGWFRMITGR